LLNICCALGPKHDKKNDTTYCCQQSEHWCPSDNSESQDSGCKCQGIF
jgi:hypothetical protein